MPTSKGEPSYSPEIGVLRWRQKSDGLLLETLFNDLAESQSLKVLDLRIERLTELVQLGAIYLNEKRFLDWNVFLRPTLQGTSLRIHTKPRRFDLNKIDWQSRVIFINNDFLVFNKPAGIPCHPLVDNYKENLAIGLSGFLGSQVLVTHRLDVATRGLLVFARTRDFQRRFNQLLSERKVVKRYRLWSRSPLPFKDGEVLTHYMHPTKKAPKILEKSPFFGGLRCDLKVLRVEGFMADIELLTGRPQQIRAQLAFEGCSLVSDPLYGATIEQGSAENQNSGGDLGLVAKSLKFSDPLSGKEFEFSLAT